MVLYESFSALRNKKHISINYVNTNLPLFSCIKMILVPTRACVLVMNNLQLALKVAMKKALNQAALVFHAFWAMKKLKCKFFGGQLS